MRNRIAAESARLYEIDLPHLFVDGERLDQLLAHRCGRPDLEGLVPSWLDWWESDTDPEFVHVKDRVLPGPKPVELPILLCLDDFDFHCTCVVVAVSADEHTVRWHRFGLDVTAFDAGRPPPRYIGGGVEWFNPQFELVFDREKYLACVAVVSNGRLPQEAPRAALPRETS